VDLALYQQKYPETLDPQAFERSTLDAQGMPDCIAPNHRLSHFLHSMSDMYAAQYYCYLWAAVLDSDVYAAFRETGNFFDPKTAQRLQAEIYSSGNTRDPMVRFTAFRGRPPTRDALLEDRGLKD
jgi:peptidyl-dipeptidase Dcp